MDISSLIEESESQARDEFPEFERSGLVDGPNRMRVLGSWAKYFEHFVEVTITAQDKTRKKLKLPYYTAGQDADDPLNNYLRELRRSGDPVKEKIASDAYGKRRYVMNCVPMANDGTIDPWCMENKHTKLLSVNKKSNNFGPTIFDGITNCGKTREQFAGKGKGDPELYDIIITRSGQKQLTEYRVESVPGFENAPFPHKFELYDIKQVTKLTDIKSLNEAVDALRARVEVASREPVGVQAGQSQPSQPQLQILKSAPEEPAVSAKVRELPCIKCSTSIKIVEGSSAAIVCPKCGEQYAPIF